MNSLWFFKPSWCENTHWTLTWNSVQCIISHQDNVSPYQYCDKVSQVNLELQIFDDTLTWFVKSMHPHGCVNTHHLGDFLMRVNNKRRMCRNGEIMAIIRDYKWQVLMHSQLGTLDKNKVWLTEFFIFLIFDCKKSRCSCMSRSHWVPKKRPPVFKSWLTHCPPP